MRRCLLLLTGLVPFVLAPRPPDPPGSGSPPRLGKDAGVGWAGPEARCFRGRAGRRSRCLGAGYRAALARPSVFCVEGVWLGVGGRMGTGLPGNGKGAPAAASRGDWAWEGCSLGCVWEGVRERGEGRGAARVWRPRAPPLGRPEGVSRPARGSVPRPTRGSVGGSRGGDAPVGIVVRAAVASALMLKGGLLGGRGGAAKGLLAAAEKGAGRPVWSVLSPERRGSYFDVLRG